MTRVDLDPALRAALGGGPERHHTKTAEQGKIPVRERVSLLLDEGTFVEDALLAKPRRHLLRRVAVQADGKRRRAVRQALDIFEVLDRLEG